MYTRRQVLKSSALLAALGLADPLELLAASPRPRFRVGACDWSIHAANKPEAFAVAKKIGLEGVQVSLGNVTNHMHLTRKDVQQAYKIAAKQAGLKFSGLAIGEMNSVPYKSDPRTEQWVSDSIDVAKELGCKVVLLAFFSKGDLKNDLPGQKEVIKRLQKVAPKAEKQGITLGIESWLSAAEHKEIIDAVGSPNIKVYYDVANSHHMGYPIYDEIRWLGKDHICEFHAKENGNLLGKGKIDFKEVRKALDDINYTGWIQIEGAVPPKQPMLESYISNNKFLRSVLDLKPSFKS
ncbi:MAG TPA: sugar phosphate isomerase/epimerase family protein [Sphingobacteriaceae bacterium]